MNIGKVQELIKQKYISVQKHPSENLFIYNYTQKAQFDRVWTPETKMCRGLILDADHNIVARPFEKFFNLEEEENLPAEDFQVFEKLDGSLGILYWVNGDPFIATRGSFESDQAMVGTQLLRKHHLHGLNKDYTYLFEIIYPENRIVVDYGDKKSLVLLGIRDKEGRDLPYQHLSDTFEVAKTYDGLDDIEKLRELSWDNSEGFVIRFVSGKRIKIKFEEYVRLHRIVTGINARRIWDMLRNNEPLDEVLERVPDEFFKWVREKEHDLTKQYNAIHTEAYNIFLKAKEFETRKDQALFIKDATKHQDVVFALLDGKDVAPIIWKKLRPEHETPFAQLI